MTIYAPRGYSPETVLTIDQVAEWLQVGVRTVEREDYPCFWVGARKRFLAKKVLEHIEKKYGGNWTVSRGRSA